MKHSYILLLSLLLSNVVLAQDESVVESALDQGGNHKNAVEVQLHVGLNNGQTVVAPYLKFRFFLKPKLVLRTGIGINYNDTTTNFRENLDGSGASGKYSNSTMKIFVPIGMEFHFKQNKKISPYAGFDILFGYAQTTGEGQYGNNTGWVSNDYSIASSTASMMYGLNVIIGVDWFFVPRLYLGAEVGIGFVGTLDFEGESQTTVGGISTSSIVPPSSTSSIGNNFQSGIRFGWKF
jgi:hypothetical protein